MSVTDMQAYLARLYLDRAFRRLFELDPEAAFSGYCLTPDERRAVEDIDKEKLNFFAISLVNKRKERIQRAYPLSYRLNSTVVDHYFQRYAEVCVANPRHASGEDVIAFGHFFEESTTYADDTPDYVSELARFERLTYSTSPASSADTSTLAETQPAADDRPVRNPGACVETFSFDFIALADMAEDDAGSPQPGQCRLLVIPAEGATGGRVMRVNDATNLLFNVCDGARNLAEVTAEIERRLDAQGLEKPVRESVQKLVSLRALRLEKD